MLASSDGPKTIQRAKTLAAIACCLHVSGIIDTRWHAVRDKVRQELALTSGIPKTPLTPTGQEERFQIKRDRMLVRVMCTDVLCIPNTTSTRI